MYFFDTVIHGADVRKNHPMKFHLNVNFLIFTNFDILTLSGRSHFGSQCGLELDAWKRNHVTSTSFRTIYDYRYSNIFELLLRYDIWLGKLACNVMVNFRMGQAKIYFQMIDLIIFVKIDSSISSLIHSTFVYTQKHIGNEID